MTGVDNWKQLVDQAKALGVDISNPAGADFADRLEELEGVSVSLAYKVKHHLAAAKVSSKEQAAKSGGAPAPNPLPVSEDGEESQDQAEGGEPAEAPSGPANPKKRKMPGPTGEKVVEAQKKKVAGAESMRNMGQSVVAFVDKISGRRVLQGNRVKLAAAAAVGVIALGLVAFAYLNQTTAPNSRNVATTQPQSEPAQTQPAQTEPTQSVSAGTTTPQTPSQPTPTPPSSTSMPPIVNEPAPPIPAPSATPPLAPAQVYSMATKEQAPVAVSARAAEPKLVVQEVEQPKEGLQIQAPAAKEGGLQVYSGQQAAKTAVYINQNNAAVVVAAQDSQAQSAVVGAARASSPTIVGGAAGTTSSGGVLVGTSRQGSAPSTPAAPAPNASPLPPGISPPPSGGSTTVTPPRTPAPPTAPSAPTAPAPTAPSAPTAPPTAPAFKAPPPGTILNGELVLGVTLVEGGTVPAVVKDENGQLWLGRASVNAARRVEITFDRVSFESQVAAASGVAYSTDGFPGVPAAVFEEAPSIAADLLRGAMGGVAEYARNAARQNRVRRDQSGTVIETILPDIGTFVGGAVADLFAVRTGEKALVRVVQVQPATKVRIFVGASNAR